MSHIIQQKAQQPNREAWILDLIHVITDPFDLYRLLELDNHDISFTMLQAKKQFPLRVPRPFVEKMKKGDINDPLLLQVISTANELIHVDGYSVDPLHEQENAIPCLLHKYQNRALLITKTNCAINCRYCFRRHFPYAENQSNKENIRSALNYIQSNAMLEEIILSGGDPLMAKDHEIAWLISALEAIPHIQRLRIHSRLIAVIPNRVTEQLLQHFQQTRLQIVLVTHINHPNEIGDDVIHAMKRLKQHNVTLLNQSVLLKNINDNANVLAQLSNKLFEAGILPYYLHLLDRVQGAAHFMVDDEQAQNIMRELSAKISGYLVPKLAREVAGEMNKRTISY